MNIQICVPYQKCPFNCPMCVANGRKVFNNLYKENGELYLTKAFSKIVGSFNDYVITGSTEPTLNKKWLTEILKLLEFENVELQTKNYNLKGYNLKYLNTLSYSIISARDLRDAWKYRKIKENNRLVILLTKDFDYLNINNFSTMGYNQITFKTLQLTADKKTNKWIKENEMKDFSNIYKIVNHYNGNDVSVRIDTTCQDSEGRYKIFRENGKIYNNWGEE